MLRLLTCREADRSLLVDLSDLSFLLLLLSEGERLLLRCLSLDSAVCLTVFAQL